MAGVKYKKLIIKKMEQAPKIENANEKEFQRSVAHEAIKQILEDVEPIGNLGHYTDFKQAESILSKVKNSALRASEAIDRL